MTDFKVSTQVDISTQTAYITLSDAAPSISKELTDDIILDLDAFGRVCGIEILDFDAPIPFSDLLAKHHVPSAVVDQVRKILPTFRQWLYRASYTNDAYLEHAGFDGSRHLVGA